MGKAKKKYPYVARADRASLPVCFGTKKEILDAFDAARGATRTVDEGREVWVGGTSRSSIFTQLMQRYVREKGRKR